MFSRCRECRVVGKVCAYSIILLHIDLTYCVASHCCNTMGWRWEAPHSTSVAQLRSCASTQTTIILPFQGVAPCVLAVVGIFLQAGVALFLLLRACVLRRVVWIAPENDGAWSWKIDSSSVVCLQVIVMIYRSARSVFRANFEAFYRQWNLFFVSYLIVV